MPRRGETEKPRVQSKAGGTLGQVAFGSCCRSGGQWAPGRAERGTFHTPGGENRGAWLGSQEGPPLTHATYVLPMGAQSRTQSSPHRPPDSPLPLPSTSKTHAETMAPALHPPGTPHWEHRQWQETSMPALQQTRAATMGQRSGKGERPGWNLPPPVGYKQAARALGANSRPAGSGCVA